MDEELRARLKSTFKTYHTIVFGMFLIVYLVLYIEAGKIGGMDVTQYFVPSFVIGLLAIIGLIAVNDFELIKNKKLNNAYNCLYIFVMVGLSMYIQYEYGRTMFILLAIENIFENSTRISYEEEDRKAIQLVILGSGFSLEYICFFLVRKYSTSSLLIGVIMYSVIVIIAAIFMTVNGHIIEFYDEKIFSKARMLDEVNNTNLKLVDNQEKINRANEMLGMQKIKLEAAYNKINRINTEMVILNNIIKTINESKKVKELVELITKSVCEGISMDVCGVVIDAGVADNKEKIVNVKSGFSNSFYDSFLKFISEGDFPYEFDITKVVIDNKVDSTKYRELNTNIIGSILMIPLEIDSKIVGRLYVGSSKYGYFKDDISFYNSIVAQFLIGIKNIKMLISLENMAIRDGLTGIYNRRQLNVFERQWIDELDKSNQSLTSVLLDIDKFKNINDSYGHQAGDMVIRGVASTISEAVEDLGDAIVARYGGEEFVILFNNHDFEDVKERVEALHERIKSRQYRHNGQDIRVNVSIGISSFPQTCDDPQAVLNRSDWAMYYSKQNGRGRITIDNPEVDKLRK